MRRDPENGGMAGASPLCSFKKGATGEEVPFHNSITGISWFIKIDMKHIYCSYSGTQNIHNDFL